MSVTHLEAVVARRVAAKRTQLERDAGVSAPRRSHLRRPEERPFTSQERNTTTILFGGLAPIHDTLVKAVFEGSGYRCQNLPTPDLVDFHTGKEYSNNGQCNPAYFTIGSLIRYLQRLERDGLSREDILGRYVFFTAGSCGPCRFGMYEAEYRLALENAGFGGFRVLLFQQNQGIRQAAIEPGLKYTLDFGLGMYNALRLGDVVRDLAYHLRPYEITPGETDRALAACIEELSAALKSHERFSLTERAPGWLVGWLSRRKRLFSVLDKLGRIRTHLAGPELSKTLARCRDRFGAIAIDRLRAKPIVKVTGEFWAQTTEGDGNYRMFEFLEREGAQVLVEPASAWLLYLIHQAKQDAWNKRRLAAKIGAPSWRPGRSLGAWIQFEKRRLLFTVAERLHARLYRHAVRAMGNLGDPLVAQDQLARLAHPFYHSLARGGEGFLEVGKNIYYCVNRLAHMVLSLKPFGCMPSSQSDGIQSAVVARFPDMIFLPIETSGDGEVNAHSRVQMALGEARLKVRTELERTLRSTGKSLGELHDFVGRHPELQRPFPPVPRHPGVTSVAANFALHVSRMMDRARPFPRR